MSAMASQITSVSIVCSTVCSGADQRKHQISASRASVKGIHRWPLNSLHNKGPVTRKMFPFDDVLGITGEGGFYGVHKKTRERRSPCNTNSSYFSLQFWFYIMKKIWLGITGVTTSIDINSFYMEQRCFARNIVWCEAYRILLAYR